MIRRTHKKTLYSCLATTIALFILCEKTVAQDPVYSQPFLSPVYLNPAATGCGENDLRVSAIYRRHWWSVPSTMNYAALSVDKYLPAIGGGVGILATHSSEGYLAKNGIYASYAYHICGGTNSVAENGDVPSWFMTLGLQAGLAQTRINYDKLIFYDQLDINGYIPNSTSGANKPINSGHGYPDFAAGAFFNKNFGGNRRLLLGFSAHHLNTPDESLTFSGDSIRSQLPIRWTGNMLFTNTNEAQTFTYSLGGIYYQQAFNKNLQIGGEATFNKYDLSLGAWYRVNLPDQYSSYKNVNAFVVTLSLNLTGNSSNKVLLGVAHDFESGNKALSKTTGSTELGVVWDYSTYNQAVDNPCKPVINTFRCPGL